LRNTLFLIIRLVLQISFVAFRYLGIYQYVGRFSFDAAHLRNIDLRRKSRLCPIKGSCS
jgi:hypothetical protein